MKLLILHANEVEEKLLKLVNCKKDIDKVMCVNVIGRTPLNIRRLIIYSDISIFFYNEEMGKYLLNINSREFTSICNIKEKIIFIYRVPMQKEFYELCKYSIWLDYNNKEQASIVEKFIKDYVTRFLNRKNIKNGNNNEKYNKIYSVLEGILIIFMFIIFIVVQNTSTSRFIIIDDMKFNLYETFCLISILICLIAFIRVRNLKNKYNEDKEPYIDKARNLLLEELPLEENSDNKDKEINALGRMLLNLNDIQEFYRWTQKQAKGSFILSIVLIIIGILLIITSIIFSIYKNTVSISIIGTIGGVATEFIAGTALIIYKSSLQQLNHYHHALHEDERFLSGVNLVNSLSNSEKKDEMITQIICSELELNKLELEQKKEK